MKKAIKISIYLMVAILGSNKVYSQKIGANFNENIEYIDPLLIEQAGVNWVRGFVNIPRFFLQINKDNKIAIAILNVKN
jgi:hypothetical protein